MNSCRANVGTVQVDHLAPYHEDWGGIEDVGIWDAVMTELDPLHLQKLPAHVPLEEPGGDGLPLIYLVAPHRLLEQDAIGVGIHPHLHELGLVP